jgi:hypothetical protein
MTPHSICLWRPETARRTGYTHETLHVIGLLGDRTKARVSKSQGILDRLLNLPNAALVSVESACLAQ